MVEVVHRAAEIDFRLRHLLATLTAVSERPEQFREFRGRTWIVLRLIDELCVEGRDYVEPWDYAHLPDEHLRRVIDLTESLEDWVPPIEERLLEVAYLVTRTELPDWVLRHFRIARRCFALEMYDATWVFLRATIEAVSFHYLSHRGHLPGGERVRAVAEWRLQDCLRIVRQGGQVSATLMKEVDDVVRRANHIIHRKREVGAPGEADTLRAIRHVVDYAERLLR